MKVFLPFQQELNPYLEEIIRYSENEYSYGAFQEYNRSYEIVNIHWPEALFDWLEPTEDDLKELEKHILEWKKHSVLVYTKHDFQRNKGTTRNLTKLFRLVEELTDVFIHLGKFSHEYYSEKYPKLKHEIVYHPLYNHSFQTLDKYQARKDLKIDKNALVVIVPGTIRGYRERDLILNSFKSLKKPNKVLICTNQHSEIRFDFPGRIKLKRIIDIKKKLVTRFRAKYQPPEYIITYDKISDEELELKMSASDVVLIPRINNLNSGLVFLGLTFSKIIVGPECGNIEEQLKEIGFPTFEPGSLSSVKKALEKGVEMDKSGYIVSDEILKKYRSPIVASEMDKVFKKALIS